MSEYNNEPSGTGWFVGIIVALALVALAYLLFVANSEPATAAPTVQNSITNIQPAKKNLGCSLAQAAQNDGVCISKELVLSD